MSQSKLNAVSEPRLYPAEPRDFDSSDAWQSLERLPGAVLVLDASGVVLHINDLAELRLVRARADVLGRDLFREVLPWLESEGVGAKYRAAAQQEQSMLQWETRIPGSTGDDVPMGMTVRMYRRRDANLGLLLVEDRSGVAREAQQRREAERFAAVGELATGVAHEINNPLASIKSFAQLLARDATSPEQIQALDIISSESSRIARVINNLLDFAQQQRIRKTEPLSLSELSDGVLALKEYALQTAGIAIQRDLDPALSPVAVECGAVQRAVLALLSHAERSLNESEGERQLALRTCESTEGVALYISDNGPGIPREQMPNLFAGSREDADYGLTLSGAAMVIAEQGGHLWVDSAPGRGTSFCVRFPRAAPPQSVPVQRSGGATAVAPQPRRGLRVLVADDEATLRLALSLYLGRHGHEVHQAADVQEALALVQQHRFDVALVDVRMPGDGLTLLDALDQIPEMVGRSVLMTGDAVTTRLRDERTLERTCLSKPFDMEEVLHLVESLAR